MSAIKDGISKATESAQGIISVEGDIGKNKARGSIDSEGVWDIGVDFKVGGLGITNDYGGAITVSIAGQSITWGREGGKIHYNVGGFEVIVEARDCVVTETKLILGIVVASHTYPDPGCELPQEEEPQQLEPPEPPPESDGTEKIDFLDFAWVALDVETNWTAYDDFGGGVRTNKSGINNTKSRVKNGSPGLTPNLSLDVERHFQLVGNTTFQRVHADGNNDLTGSAVVKYEGNISFSGALTPALRYWAFNNTIISRVLTPPNYPYNTSGPGIPPYVVYGTGANIKAYIKERNSSADHNVDYANSSNGMIANHRYVVGVVVKQKEALPVKPQPFLKPGVPPHMNDCCEDILDSLEDLKDVLHVEFFKKKKFPVPSYLLAPGCDPGKTVDAENYYHLFQKMFQALAHSTIINPKIEIQDADSVKEGDQTIKSQYLSATGWAEAITKMLYEIVDDGNVATNMDIRTGVTVTQLMVAVADLSYKLDCVIDLIGIPTKRTKGEVETSYNLVVEGENTKGFDPKKSNQQLDLNSDVSTEKLLASLLKTRKNPIVKEEIHPKSPTLFEMFQKFVGK